jgi:hypothetical protein
LRAISGWTTPARVTNHGLRFLVPLVSFASLIACVATSTPLSAQGAPPATRVLVLRVGGEPLLASALGPNLREAAYGHVRALGLVPLPTDGACEDLDCADGFLSTGAADAAAFVEVYGSNGVCQGVQATVLLGESHRFVGTAEVGTAGINEAMRVALTQAVARSRGEARPTLGVNGAPAGATIRVDGITWGTVPHHEPVSPGAHVIEVRARGFRTERREVTLSGDDLSLEIALLPGEDAGDASARADTTPLWIASAGALVLGVAGMVVGFAGLALGESCDPPGCVTYSRPDLVASGAWIGGGGALAVAGGVLIIIAATMGPAASGGASQGPGAQAFGGLRGSLTLGGRF